MALVFALIVIGWVLIGMISTKILCKGYTSRNDVTVKDMVGFVGMWLCGPVISAILITDMIDKYNYVVLIKKKK